MIGWFALEVVTPSGIATAQTAPKAQTKVSAQSVAQGNAGQAAEGDANVPAPSEAEAVSAPPEAPAVSTPTETPKAAERPATPSGNSAIEKLITSQPDWACQYDAHAMTERHVIVACKEGSVLTLARTPTGVQLLGRRETNGRVEAFYEQDDSVWMRVVEERAERVVPGAIGRRTVPCRRPPRPHKHQRKRKPRQYPSKVRCTSSTVATSSCS